MASGGTGLAQSQSAASAPARGSAGSAPTSACTSQSAPDGEKLRAAAQVPNASAADVAAWVGWLVDHGRSGQAVEELTALGKRRPLTPELHWQAARAYFELDQLLGATTEQSFAEAAPGQFRRNLYLLARRDGDRFTCCPQESAIYQLRCALDGGVSHPAIWLLAARVWQRLGDTTSAYQILKDHEPALLDAGDSAALALLAELALAAHEPADYLRLMRWLAAHDAGHQTDILYEAQRALAEYYAARGEDALSLDALRRAVTLKSENPTLVLELADREYDGGDRAAARRWYRRVLELAPWHSQRARLLERLGNESER